MKDLFDLLTSPVMHGAVIRFHGGLTYTVGQGWCLRSRRISAREAHARLAYWWGRREP
jgi:hypothetical protein